MSFCVQVTATGVGVDSYRCLLGPDAMDAESCAGRLARPAPFTVGLRGVGGVVCIVSDAHAGLRHAVKEGCSQGAAWCFR